MMPIDRLIAARLGNIRQLGDLREVAKAELKESPFKRPEPPAEAIECALLAYLDACRRWHSSLRLVTVVTELEVLARSFGAGGRVRGLRRLSAETVALLLDEAPGGTAVAFPVVLTSGRVEGVGPPRDTTWMLIDRLPETTDLIGRLRSDPPAASPVAGVAVVALPRADGRRLNALFADPDAPGRGDLGDLRRTLSPEDRELIATAAERAAIHLKFAVRIDDKRTDHQRSRTVANFLEPAPLARLALAVTDLVVPREAPYLIRGRQLGLGRRGKGRPAFADQVRYVFAEAVDAARRIAAGTEELRDLDLFCGIDIARRVSDLTAALDVDAVTRERAAPDFDRAATAARRLLEATMDARDTLLLLRAYEATLLAYTDKLLARRKLTPDLRSACDRIVHDVCGALTRRYRLAKADLDDGVTYWVDVKRRVSGSAPPRRWLPASVLRTAVRLSGSPPWPVLARPKTFAILDEIVADVAADIEARVVIERRLDVTDGSFRDGPALRAAWEALKDAHPPHKILEKKRAARA